MQKLSITQFRWVSMSLGLTLKKIPLVMKLFFVFMLSSISLLHASGSYAQTARISLETKNQTVQEVLEQIEAKSNFSFFYNNRHVDLNRKVSVSVDDADIFKILDAVFSGTNVGYSVVENRIVLSVKSSNPVISQKGNKITGTVVDAAGIPIIGANVMVKGTTNGAVTDINGKFSLNVEKGDLLEVSYIGYLSSEIKIGNEQSLAVTLKEDTKTLDEVVVVGYGTQKRGNLTGSIATVKSEEMTVAPVSSTINSLGGRLPGLVSQQTSGQPGADQATISVRGFDCAIWIVDGIEMDFNRIDPNQIESISILKDGSASIYGARAGNGVILVTTKRGVQQKPTISVNSSITFQGITTMPKPVSSGDYATLRREEWLQSGKPESTAPYTEEQIQKFYDGTDPQYVNTDWYNELIRNWSPLNQHNISVRGGSEKIKYYGFLGYLGQESIWKHNGGNYKRYNLQSNIDASITSQLSMQLDLSFIKSDNMTTIRPQNNAGVWQDLWNTLPVYPAHLPDPTKISYADGKGTGGAHVTSNTELSGYQNEEKLNLNGTIALKYAFKHIKGLSAKFLLNYYDQISYVKLFNRPSTFYRYDVASDTYINAGGFGNSAQLTQRDDRSKMLTRQFSVNYDNTFAEDHSLSVLALYEAIDYSGNWMSASREDLLTPSIEELFVGNTETMKNDGASSEMGRKSFVGRFNYSYKNKYLLETTLRADASAKFAPGHRWGIFPSASVGWRISEESFMSNTKSIVDDLKIRASYGRSGNDAVGNFQYLSGYKLNGYYLLGDKSMLGIATTGLANPNLTWEKFEIWNVGLNYSFLSRLIYGEGDVFYRKRSGIPATRTMSMSPTFGATFPQENINSLNDRGFEFMVGSSKSFKNFSYDISGNISWSRAKWDHYEEQIYTDPDQKRINQKSGQWVDRQFGYISDGLFTSQEEIDNLDFDQDNKQNTSLRPGDIRYVDVNGDRVLDWKDQVEIGKGTMPHWMYGLNVNLKYKDFDLAALFQGAFGYSSYISLWHNTLTYPQELFDLRWSENNNVADALYPRLGGAATNGHMSDYFYKKAGYLRLKSFALGYNLSKELCTKLLIQQCRVYFAGTNLFTFDKLSKYHIDPEAPSGQGGFYYPQQKTLSVGINLSF